MPLKPIVQALAVVWLLLFVASFISLRSSDPNAGETDTLARVATFLTWQAIAFVVAALTAFAARYAATHGVERVKMIGYVPLGLSVFLVASFVVLMGFRFYVFPLFE